MSLFIEDGHHWVFLVLTVIMGGGAAFMAGRGMAKKWRPIWMPIIAMVPLTLGLRFDAGRRESTSGELAGLGSVKSTVRARLAGRYRFDDHWQLNGAWSADAFGRGGGHYGEFSLERHQRWSPDTTWVAGAGFSAAGDRYLQSWFGVTPEQSARSGYAVYEPAAGLRDASVYANLRSQVAPRWVLLAGASATRLLGSAADSPLVRQRSTWSLNGGLAWNF
jgi:outer membrane scaffolding protein for murein synthesis (MipA/OmpV family)